MEIIRKATLKDMPSILELNLKLTDYVKEFDKNYKESSKIKKVLLNHLREIIQKRNVLILIAEINGKVVGTIRGQIEKPFPYYVPNKVGRVSGAFVEKEYRQLGLGRKMLNMLILWFKENSIKHIGLAVESENELGVSAWKKFGFKEKSKIMHLEL